MTKPRLADPRVLLGHRKNGQPIYLACGGDKTATARRRFRASADVVADIEIQRGIVLEVADLDDPQDADLERQNAALDLIPDLELERAETEEHEDEIQRLRELDLSGSTEPGDQRDTPNIQRRRTAGAGPAVIVKGDHFEILRSNNGHMGEREIERAYMDANLKALDDVEMPKGYDGSAEMYLKRHRKDVSWSRNLLARQRPDYLEAWEKTVTGRELLMNDVERAAIAVGTNTAGGYLVPTHLDPTLILTNAGAKDVVRGLSRVVSLTGGANKWNGVTTAGSTASWDAELTEVSDDTPPVAPVQIPVFSAKSLLQASIESFEDISGLASDVQMLLADSRTRLEAAAHISGNGTTQPTGIVVALDANTNDELSLTTGHTWTLADLQRVANALGDRWTDGAEWLIHPNFLGEIQALGTALGATYTTDLTQPFTQQLLGHHVTQSFTMPSVSQTTTVDNLLVFGLFENYVIVDKPGSTSIEFIPHLFNTSNNLPDGRRAWYMHFRNGADSVNDLAFRLLQDKTTA
jgi:HK97 family phage major capsid protein